VAGGIWCGWTEGAAGGCLHAVQQGCGEQDADGELLGQDLSERAGRAGREGQEGAESCRQELQREQEQVMLERDLV
jgi:hypothetical protein